MRSNSSLVTHWSFWSLVYSKPSGSGFPSAQCSVVHHGIFRENNVFVLGLHRVPGLVARDHHFMQLFAGPNAGDLDLALGRQRLGQVQDLHAWNPRDEQFAAVHLLDGAKHESHALAPG